MPRKLPSALKAACFALYSNGLSYPEIAERTSVPVDTIRQWACRDTWADTRDTSSKPYMQLVQSTVVDTLREQGERTRGMLASVIERSAQVASEYQPRTLDDVRNVGTAIEPLARTAKIVHDYGEKRASLVAVGVGRLLDEDEAPRTIDCQVSDAPSDPGETGLTTLPDAAPADAQGAFTDEAAGI